MIRRRASTAEIKTKLGNHSFRATGITAHLKNGGTLEKAAAMANHASTRTTHLCDRRLDELSLDEVERIVINSPRFSKSVCRLLETTGGRSRQCHLRTLVEGAT